MAYFEINDKKVHVIELNATGERVIILVHGLFTSLSVYYFSIAPILAKKYRVILYDLRTHGLSERRDEGYSPEILSNDLLALMDKMHIERACLAGYSFGGLVAMYTALRHPERASRLALIDTPMLWEPEFERLTADESDFDRSIEEYKRSMRVPMTDAVVERIKAKWVCLFEDDRIAKSVNRGRRLFDETPPENLQIPTLLLYGSRSPYVKTGRVLVSRIRNARLEIGWGDHNLPAQNSLWVALRLKSFFSRPSPKESAIALATNIFALGGIRYE